MEVEAQDLTVHTEQKATTGVCKKSLETLGHNLTLTFKTPSTDNHFVLAACLAASTDKTSMGLDR